MMTLKWLLLTNIHNFLHLFRHGFFKLFCGSAQDGHAYQISAAKVKLASGTKFLFKQLGFGRVTNLGR